MTPAPSPRLAGLLVAAIAASAGARADDAFVHIRGSVVSLAGDRLAVQSREGPLVVVTLDADVRVAGVDQASLDAIRPGDFVGVASLPGAKGEHAALEVSIFPPAMRGTGEGRFDWDLRPGSSLTNGAVAEVTRSAAVAAWRSPSRTNR